MKQVIIRGGAAVVEDVPAPQVDPGCVLVRVRSSCVSVGTEMASVRESGQSLYQRVRRQPQQLAKVLQRVREEGLQRTANFVKGKLNVGFATGYSAAGEVLAVGAGVEGFVAGERVACAGANAAHAEVINVPVNLVVRVPDGVDYGVASSVTLGAIALQGVRRAAPTLGETIVVIGLGLLGQLTAQMLRANGCRVIGVDVRADRIRLALANGMDHGVDATVENVVERIHSLTDGFGADAAIVTASARDDQVISDAMQACRKKGRVVLVGDVGLNLKRSDLYPKELDFFISTSYGPGRYDPVYEEHGHDYPLPYVRWTENRNMAEYLRLLADRRITLENLVAPAYPVDQAGAAYDAQAAGADAPLLVLLSYPAREGALQRRVAVSPVRRRSGAVRVALVGAGSFARGVHLPNLAILKEFELRAVMSRNGANARAAAQEFGAAYAATDYAEILADADVDLVLIATRHDLHARMALQALRAGKNVLLEKPLALTPSELEEVERFYAAESAAPLLLTGFNRRFSPAMQRAREALAQRSTPLVVNYRMNAGYVPPEAWVHGEEGGGRNIGEACHIYDVFNFLTDAPVCAVQAAAITPGGEQWKRNDNFLATISYADGSVCSLTYTALGNRAYPKERMEIFADGMVISLDDFTSLRVVGRKGADWRSSTQDKGQLHELRALGRALREGGAWPIPLWQQVQATAISFEVERQISGVDA